MRRSLDSIAGVDVVAVEPQRDEFFGSLLVDSELQIGRRTVRLLDLDAQSIGREPTSLVFVELSGMRPICRRPSGAFGVGVDLLTDERVVDLGIRNLEDLTQRVEKLHDRLASLPRDEAGATEYGDRRCWVARRAP
jgi:hypothetical protein